MMIDRNLYSKPTTDDEQVPTEIVEYEEGGMQTSPPSLVVWLLTFVVILFMIIATLVFSL